MKTLNLIAAFLITATIVFATNEKAPVAAASSTTITGKVIDKITGEALAGVKIAINETSDAVYTDLDGNFEISNIKLGAQKIVTNLISYETSSVDIECNANSNNIEIELDNK